VVTARTLEAPHDVTCCVAHCQHDSRLLFFLLGLQDVPTRKWCVATLFGDLLLLLLSFLLFRLEPFLQVVGKDRAKRRVGSGKEIRTLVRLPSITEWRPRDVPPGVSHRKELHRLLEHLLGDPTQRGVVVEDIEAAAKGRPHQIVLPLLDGEIPERDVWHPAGELDPTAAAVDGEKDAKLGADKKQLRSLVVLDDPPDDVTIRQIAGDRPPGPAPVGALQHIGIEISPFVVVEHHVRSVGIVEVGLDVVDKGALGDGSYLFDPSPVGTAVLGHLDQTVVGTGVDQPLDKRGFRQ
jgi:hypothetical protein